MPIHPNLEAHAKEPLPLSSAHSSCTKPWCLEGRLAFVRISCLAHVLHACVSPYQMPVLHGQSPMHPPPPPPACRYLLDALLHGLAAVGIPGAANVEGTHLMVGVTLWSMRSYVMIPCAFWWQSCCCNHQYRWGSVHVHLV